MPRYQAQPQHIGVGCLLECPTIYDIHGDDRREPCLNHDPDIPVAKRSRFCDLQGFGWGHPVIVLVIEMPNCPSEMRITFVKLSNIAYIPSRRERLMLTETGATTQIFEPSDPNIELDYSFESYSNCESLKKQTWALLDHWYSMKLSEFKNWNRSFGSKACDYRLDEQSYLHLMKRLEEQGMPKKDWARLYVPTSMLQRGRGLTWTPTFPPSDEGDESSLSGDGESS